MKTPSIRKKPPTGLILAAIASTLAAGAAGCSVHESFNSTSDYDAVVTVQDPEYDYSQNKTYAVVEEVADLSEYISNPIDINDMAKWEKIIKESIHNNMQAAGYTETTGDIEEADVVVAAGVVAGESWTFYGYYPWWGWNGWYYYPGITVAVDFSSGSVILVMIDPKRVQSLAAGGQPEDAGADAGDGEEAYKAVWGAGLRALLSGITEKKVRDGIDQAFAQSPYLKQNGGDK